MYNASAYIGNCLDSLIHQDLSKDDYEIIVMDDGSTDDSVNIVERYILENSNIILFKEENAGAYPTRNKLLKLAKGDYIYNLDADDYIAHNSIGILIEIVLKNNLDILAFETIATNKLNINYNDTNINHKELKVTNGYDFLCNNRNFRFEIWWYFVRRKFLLTHKLKFEFGKYLVDVLFTTSVFIKAERVIKLSNVIHRYVEAPESIMNSSDVEHLKSLVYEYVSVISRFQSLIDSQSDNIYFDEINRMRYINNLKYKMSVVLYFMFYKLIKSNLSIKKINSILNKFKKINVYPITSFLGEEYYKKKFVITAFIFNNKFLFFSVLYPIRLLSKLNIIKLP